MSPPTKTNAPPTSIGEARDDRRDHHDDSPAGPAEQGLDLWAMRWLRDRLTTATMWLAYRVYRLECERGVDHD